MKKMKKIYTKMNMKKEIKEKKQKMKQNYQKIIIKA